MVVGTWVGKDVGRPPFTMIASSVFGGTWSACPDPVTFSDVEGVNMYKDANAFYKNSSEWQLTPTVNSRG